MSELSKTIEQQLARGKVQGQTTDFIRQFVFTVVDRALRDHYGQNYSIRCLQSTFGILDVLAEFGIKGKAWSGAVCVAGVTTGSPFEAAWHGFWGDDHHAWAVTEQMELVDLTISQLHLHPASGGKEFEPMPPVWWNPIDEWPEPVIIKYLPDGLVVPGLSPDESADFDAFRARVKTLKRELMETLSIDDVLSFQPVLYGMNWLNMLNDTGHPWLTKTVVFDQRELAMPPWIVQREQEVNRAARKITGF